MVIREMTPADVPAGLRLCRASGWNQTAEDWRVFLATAPHGSLVAVEDDAVVGTVSTMPYGEFTWISMVLVDPAARRRGIGTTLLTRGLALVPPGSIARLDATPWGEPVYAKLGFIAECDLTRWFVPPRAARLGGVASARRLTADDWPAVLESDGRAFGASRAMVLERLFGEAPELAWVVEQDGHIRGHLFGRRGHVRDHLGPVVAADEDTAGRLIEACLNEHATRTFFIDAPDAQRAFSDRLARLGFSVERPFRRMHLGPLTPPGRPSDVYAITGAEFG